jgi:hypothetical protein
MRRRDRERAVADQFVHRVEGALVPAWRRVTQGEQRWPGAVGMAAAIGMQLALPSDVELPPRWLMPSVELALLIALLITNPGRIDRRDRYLRIMSLVLIAFITIGNAVSATRLIVGLVRGTFTDEPSTLLLVGGAIWLTNVIAFSLWYWEFDRGGPVARAHALKPYPDFLFAQMQASELAPPDWEPSFVDYVYLSFTNAAAFSPTDVLPLSRWAKMTMLLQSAISLATVALVIARAVNILK